MQPALQVPAVPPLKQILSIARQQGPNEALSTLIRTPSLNESSHGLHPPYLWTDTCCLEKKPISLIGGG